MTKRRFCWCETASWFWQKGVNIKFTGFHKLDLCRTSDGNGQAEWQSTSLIIFTYFIISALRLSCSILFSYTVLVVYCVANTVQLDVGCSMSLLEDSASQQGVVKTEVSWVSECFAVVQTAEPLTSVKVHIALLCELFNVLSKADEWRAECKPCDITAKIN